MLKGSHVLWWILSALMFFLICASRCSAAFEHLTIGARPGGMGGAFVALADDPEALFWNPAGLEHLSGRGFSAFMARPFGVEDITLCSAGFIQPTRWGRGGTSFRTFGTKVYRENTFGLSHGRRVREGLYVGATLKIFNLRIDGYGSALAAGIDIGCLIEIERQIYGGLCIQNVNGPRIGEAREEIPKLFSLGLRSAPADDLILSAEVRKESMYGARFHIGNEYRMSKVLAVRTGWQTNPADFTAGFGFYFGRYRLDYAFSSHSVLGLTHQASFTIR